MGHPGEEEELVGGPPIGGGELVVVDGEAAVRVREGRFEIREGGLFRARDVDYDRFGLKHKHP